MHPTTNIEYFHLEVTEEEWYDLLRDPGLFFQQSAPQAAEYVDTQQELTITNIELNAWDATTQAAHIPCAQAGKINSGGYMCICVPVAEVQQNNHLIAYKAV